MSDEQAVEVRCPACSQSMTIALPQVASVCPQCGRTVEIEESGDGLTLVSTQQAEDLPDNPLQQPDPVIEDYLKWQAGAVFGMLFGLACAFMVGYSVVVDMLRYGRFYLIQHRMPIAIGLVVSVGFVVGGMMLYRYVGREKRKYEMHIGIKH